MDPFSISVGVLSLVRASHQIAVALHEIINSFKDAPKGIEHFFSEYNSVRVVVEQLETFVNDPNRDTKCDQEMISQAQTVISETQTTLEQLYHVIKQLLPQKGPAGKRRAIRIGCGFLWHEKSIQVIMLRLQARRDSLSLIMNLWGSVDRARIKNDLAEIKRVVEVTLAEIRSEQVPRDGMSHDDRTLVEQAGILHISDRLPEPDVKEVEESPPTSPQPAVRNLVELFNNAETSPAGERIRRRINTLNASRAADAGRRIPGGRIPASKSRILRELSKKLAEKEAEAPGLSSLESASAAQALAKAYRDVSYFELSLEFYHQALLAREFLLGQTHPTTLNTLDSIAAVFEIQSKWDEARSYYEQSLAGRRDNPELASTHPSILATATRIARMLNSVGRLEEALRKYTQILTEYTATPNKGSTPALAVKSEIAGIYLKMKNFDEAAIQYESVLNSRVKIFGHQHPLTKETVKSIEVVEKHRQGRAPDLAPDLASDCTAKDGPSNGLNKSKTSNFTEIDSSTSASTVLGDCPSESFTLVSYQEALAEKQKSLGKQHPETLTAMFDLAQAYASNDQHEAAIGWYDECLAGRETIFGPMHPIILSTLVSLAESYREGENHNTALKYYLRALNGMEDRLGIYHQDTLSVVLAIGVVYKSQKEYSLAIDSTTRALEGRKKKFGERCASTLGAMFQLADIYKEKGSQEESLELHQQVSLIREEVLGETHQSTLSSKHAIGVVLRSLGRDSEAIPYFLQAWEGKQKTFGKLHSTTTGTVVQLASAYWATKSWRESLTYYKYALKGMQEYENNSKTSGLVFMANIALCHILLEELPEALEWQKKVLKICQVEYRSDHEDTIRASEALADTYMKMEDFDMALDLYQIVLTHKEKLLADTHEDITAILFQLSLGCFKIKQYEKSTAWGKRLLSLGDEIHPEQRLVTMRRLGIIYVHQAKHDEALEIFQKALDESKASLGEDHWLPDDIKSQITNLYLKMDQVNTASLDFQKQLKWAQNQLLIGDPAAPILLMKLAKIHAEEHLYEEALKLWETALEEINSNPDHELFNLKPTITSNIIDIHVELHNHQLALTLLSELLNFQKEDKERLNTYVRIGNIHDDDSNYQEAIVAYEEAVRLRYRTQGAAHIETLRTTRKLGALYKYTGDLQKCLSYTESALRGFRSLARTQAQEFGENSQVEVEVFRTLVLLANIYVSLGRLQDSVRAMEEAAGGGRWVGGGFAGSLGELHEESLRAGLGLAELYQGLEMRSEALKWFEKVVDGYKTKLGGNASREEGMREAAEAISRLRGGA